ncbi:MAG: class I SAM-dependent methyltransferase [Bacteroidales bacterium]|nr:class I SAM-dependent methyltransferase [Bacteroidales bacterium]
MKKSYQLVSLVKYLRQSKTRQSVHSPFVFDFINHVLRDNQQYPEYKLLDNERSRLRRSNKHVEVIDFGAGSKGKLYEIKLKKISDLARKSASQPRTSQLLFRLARYFKSQNILELGTSLGMGTLHLAYGAPEAKIVTIEGCYALTDMANLLFQRLQLNNITVENGNLDKILDNALCRFEQLDLVFFDSFHKKRPTIEYFEKCLKLAHNDSIFVFDDIHWSQEMNEAWEQIKLHPQVQVTIDLFQLGIVFFKKELSKEHFVLRY